MVTSVRSIFITALALASAPSSLALVQLRGKQNPLPSPACIVWHSQHKSGGATIEDMFSLHPLKVTGLQGPVSNEWGASKDCRFVCDRPTWNCEQSMCKEDWDKTVKALETCPARIAMRGYTPTLAGSYPWGSPRDGTCLWLTISREPVSRLVSAYFYCKEGVSTDPLCGHTKLDPRTASLHQFAKHWGNYLFRELLWYPELYEMASKRPDFDAEAGHCSLQGDSMWLNIKHRLKGGDTLETESGLQNFEAVKKKLARKELYDIIGVTERWNETMAMFNKRAELSDLDWVDATTHRKVSHGSEAWQDEEDKTLKAARKDPVILNYLAADIKLYEDVIIPLFDEELKTVL